MFISPWREGFLHWFGSLIDPDYSRIEVWFKDFLSDFHLTHLQPLGFRKRRAVFKRNQDTYVEYYYFLYVRGNKRNRRHTGTFLLRVGVKFKDISHRKHNFWILGGDCQWGRRIDGIVLGAPRLVNYNIFTNKARLKDTWQKYIITASDKISQDIDKIHEAAISKQGFVL